MKRLMKIAALCTGILVLAACSKSRPEQMVMADNVKIQCVPEVLENVAGNVSAQISVTYPEGYFHPDAIMVVTPVIVFDGGQVTGQPMTFQGENVKDNNKVVKSKGGTMVETVNFKYVSGMAQSYLELRCVAFCDSKRIDIPSIKVAEGVRNSSELVSLAGSYKYKEDGYQQVTRKTSEGRILYDVNSADVKSNQLRSRSIRELEAALKEIAANDRCRIVGTRIEAYASPEGGEELNARLSDKRATSAQKAWKNISKGMKADDFQVKSLGQDWDGFKEAIEASDLEDKELILRVLSMYSDPAVREREIRNMAGVYTEINDKVFPELRRARFVADVEYMNFTDEELEKASQTALGMLDEAGVLRVAANSGDHDRKSYLYQFAADKFNSAKAGYNLAALALDENKAGVAELYINKVGGKDADTKNIEGIVALKRGRVEEAKSIFNACGTPESKINLGTVAIMQGDYKTAEELLDGTASANEALAHFLNGNMDKAEATLKGSAANDDYLRAIIAARKGNAEDVKKYLESAISKDANLRERAAKDIEFVKFR